MSTKSGEPQEDPDKAHEHKPLRQGCTRAAPHRCRTQDGQAAQPTAGLQEGSAGPESRRGSFERFASWRGEVPTDDEWSKLSFTPAPTSPLVAHLVRAFDDAAMAACYVGLTSAAPPPG